MVVGGSSGSGVRPSIREKVKPTGAKTTAGERSSGRTMPHTAPGSARVGDETWRTPPQEGLLSKAAALASWSTLRAALVRGCSFTTQSHSRRGDATTEGVPPHGLSLSHTDTFLFFFSLRFVLGERYYGASTSLTRQRATESGGGAAMLGGAARTQPERTMAILMSALAGLEIEANELDHDSCSHTHVGIHVKQPLGDEIRGKRKTLCPYNFVPYVRISKSNALMKL